MKSPLKFFCLIIAAGFLLTAASVWEGSAAIVTSGDLPGGGYSAATNSFPRNSIIDITNLENGKTVRVIVVSDLRTSGLLATLSRNAAEAIGLQRNSVSRIRMTQPSDDIAFSRFGTGPLPSATAADAADTTVPEPQAAGPGPVNPGTTLTVPSVVLPPTLPGILTTTILAGSVPAIASANPAPTEPAETTVETPAEIAVETQAETTVETPAEIAAETPAQPPVPATSATERTIISLNHAEDRIPDAGGDPGIPSEHIIGPIERTASSVNTTNTTDTSDENEHAEFINIFAIARVGIYTEPSDLSSFTVPLITTLESGKWYVQLGAYTKQDVVENEINRIGTNVYPIAVQTIENDPDEVYRILLGPFNQGESGATLHRFKSIGYKDAFMRKN